MDRMKLQVFNKLKQLEAANMASAPVNILFNQHQAAFTAEWMLINILLQTGKLNSASSNVHALELVLKPEKSPMVELKAFILLHLNNKSFALLL